MYNKKSLFLCPSPSFSYKYIQLSHHTKIVTNRKKNSPADHLKNHFLVCLPWIPHEYIWHMYMLYKLHFIWRASCNIPWEMSSLAKHQKLSIKSVVSRKGGGGYVFSPPPPRPAGPESLEDYFQKVHFWVKENCVCKHLHSQWKSQMQWNFETFSKEHFFTFLLRSHFLILSPIPGGSWARMFCNLWYVDTRPNSQNLAQKVHLFENSLHKILAHLPPGKGEKIKKWLLSKNVLKYIPYRKFEIPLHL